VPRSGLDLLAPCGACTARSLLFGVSCPPGLRVWGARADGQVRRL